MEYPRNKRLEAMHEVAAHFPNTYNALKFLRDPLEGGKSPSELILDGDMDAVYESLDRLDDFQ